MHKTMESKRMHIVVFPWLAFGHMIPFLELSKRLASKGHRISFLSTPRNLQRLPKIPQNLASFISLIPLPLPRDDQIYNLPPNAESTMDMPPDQVQFLKKAYDGLQHPMARFLETTSPMVDWIIYDFSSHWLPPIADKLGIRKAFFFIVNAYSCLSLGSTSDMISDGGGTLANPENLTKPPKWVPHPTHIVYRLHEAKLTHGVIHKNASGFSDLFRLGTSIAASDVLSLRSCVELEPEHLQLMEKLHGKPVFPVGLLPISIEGGEGEGGKDDTWQSITEWLGKHRNGSVVYVALGSEIAPSQDQITELALGLEISQMPFFWAWRKPAGSSVELPEGFEERTRGRGLIWANWAPQPRILAHDSVGAFLTHAGWGSVVEGLQFGRPLIMLPFFFDQALNTRVMAAKKIGIEIPRNDQDGSFNRSSVAESLKVLLQDETANTFQEEAKKISEIFGNEGLHSQYFDKFEQYLKA